MTMYEVLSIYGEKRVLWDIVKELMSKTEVKP